MTRRKPTALLRLTAASSRHQGRLRGRNDGAPTPPLGEPSSYLPEGAQVAWHLFVRELPWLRESHRAIVEIAATIRARIVGGELVGVGALNLYRQCLSQSGGTPTSPDLSVPSDYEDDPTAKYFE